MRPFLLFLAFFSVIVNLHGQVCGSEVIAVKLVSIRYVPTDGEVGVDPRAAATAAINGTTAAGYACALTNNLNWNPAFVTNAALGATTIACASPLPTITVSYTAHEDDGVFNSCGYDGGALDDDNVAAGPLAIDISGIRTSNVVNFSHATGAWTFNYQVTYTQNLVYTPGGQSTGMTLWLKADAGASATAWTDQSAAGNNATGAAAPVLNAADMNFNPSFTFAAANARFSGPAGLHTDETFVVAQSTGAVTNATVGKSILGHSASANGFFSMGSITANLTNELVTFGHHTGALPANRYKSGYIGAVTIDPKPYLFSFNEDAAATPKISIHANNALVSNTEFLAGGTYQVTNGAYTVGISGDGATDDFTGKISEVISFSTTLTATQRTQVASYLAIKYGITLGNNGSTTAQYLASDGTVIYAANTGFHYNITGIGRDIPSALNQKQSVSTNVGVNENMVAMGLGTIAASNAANTGALADKSFMLFGDNNSAVALSVAVTGTDYNAMTRTWKIDETGTVGSVQVRVPKALFSNSNVALFRSSDPTFTSSDPLQTLSSSDATYYYFNGINFADGQYFTFAQAPTPGPGGLTAGLQLWLKADADTYSDAGATAAANNGTVQQWDDQSSNLNQLANTGVAQQPVFMSSGINFNPILRFNGAKYLTEATPTLGTIGNAAKEFFAVTKNVNNLTGYGTILGLSPNPPNNTNNIAYNITTPEGTGVFAGQYVTNRALPASTTIAATNLFSTYFATGNISTWTYQTNAQATGAATASGTNFNPTVSATNITVGARYNTLNNLNQPLEGDLAEVVFFNAAQTNRTRIESYLALKYGITLGATFNYVNSTGAIIWTADATYQNRITGIGRDVLTCLNQKQSKSESISGVLVTMGNGGTIAATNAANTNTFAADKTFLIFGDNAAATTMVTPVSGELAINQMARIWKTVETGVVGNAKFSIPAATFTAGSTPFMYISTDPTFTNTDERIELTLNGANYEAIPLLLARANTTFYFTFAEKIVLPVTLTLAMTASAPSVVQGASAPLSYTLTVANTSGNTAYNVKVKDQLPPGVTLGTVTPPVGTTWDAASRVWTITQLTGSANISLTIPTTVN
jgi:uncharacterized repeat protein (TIGR01451 family)